MEYSKKTPCKDCPYRKDAPLQLWDKEEFTDLLKKDRDYLGATYGCHKKDESVCIGWLMNQDKRNIPSIMLRISLSQKKVTREYLDSLYCKSEMYDTIEEMALTNYPKIKIISK
jgi:hypothetical protein